MSKGDQAPAWTQVGRRALRDPEAPTGSGAPAGGSR